MHQRCSADIHIGPLLEYSPQNIHHSQAGFIIDNRKLPE
jgi:hypothetical protein